MPDNTEIGIEDLDLIVIINTKAHFFEVGELSAEAIQTNLVAVIGTREAMVTRLRQIDDDHEGQDSDEGAMIVTFEGYVCGIPNLFTTDAEEAFCLAFFGFQSTNDSGGGMVCCAGPALLILGLMVGVYFWSRNITQRELLRDQKETANMSPEQKEKYHKNKRALASFGEISPMMVCPHCQTKGQVRTKKITKDKGISGGKATGAVLTGGLSVLATGLSRNEDVTQAHCDECNSTWHF